jgi:hypothetical protein
MPPTVTRSVRITAAGSQIAARTSRTDDKIAAAASASISPNNAVSVPW